MYNNYHILKPSFTRTNKIDCSLHVHIDSDIEILILLDGKAECVIDSKKYELKKGNAVFIFPQQPHFYRNSSNVDALIIVFKSAMFDELKYIFNNYIPANPSISETDFKKINIKLIIDNLLNDLSTNNYIASIGYSILIASKLLSCVELKEIPSKNESAFLTCAKEYCFKNYYKLLTLNDVAKAVNVSPNHLSKVFKNKFGMTFNRYLSIIRLNRACLLLASNKLSISQIAFECGFGSIRTFNRIFQKEMEISPSQYRDNINRERKTLYKATTVQEPEIL